MTVLDEIKKLDEQKNKLLEQARREALAKAESAVAELNALGFKYRLVGGATTSTTTGKRRSGIRTDILNIIKKHPNGIARADIINELDAKGDKAAEQSVSNALSALKKQGQVTNEDGNYRAA